MMPVMDLYFSVDVATTDCRSEIRINDVPISRNRRGNPQHFSVPVGQYLLPGRNILSLSLWPRPEETALAASVTARIALLARPARDESGVDQPLAAITFKSPNMGEWTVGQNAEPMSAGVVSAHASFARWLEDDRVEGLLLRHDVAVTPSIPRWAWTESDRINEDEATRLSLLGFYRALWSALQARSTGSLAKVFAERTSELARAFSIDEAEVSTVRRLQESASDPDAHLLPIGEEQAELEVFGDGRLARIVGANGRPLIRFDVRSERLLRSYDLIFRRQGSHWIVTR